MNSLPSLPSQSLASEAYQPAMSVQHEHQLQGVDRLRLYRFLTVLRFADITSNRYSWSTLGTAGAGAGDAGRCPPGPIGLAWSGPLSPVAAWLPRAALLGT